MWLLFAFSGPVLWAASTHIDKYLVDRYFRDASTAVLMVFTSLIDLLALPVIWYFVPGIFALAPFSIVVMIASGALYLGAMLLYLQAIQSEEASVVAPLFQLSVLWSAGLAYLVLGETLTPLQMAGGGIILAGAVLLSLDPSLKFRAIRLRVVFVMLGCTFVLALSSVIFKFFAVNAAFWSTTFWTYVGAAGFGLALLASRARLRQFVGLFRRNPGAMLGVNGANELINLGGGLGVRYALLLAPVPLVQAVSSTTTLFVFGFGIVLTRFFPALGREDLSARNLLQKGAAALLVALGIVLINAA
jgi:uncharacterized membrane protein